MTHLLARLEDTNDLVIVVASPILSFADSLFLATHVDGVILMARRSKTQGEMVQNSVASLRMVGASLLGTLLLNSRNGSVQIAAPIERRALVARHAEELVTRANGRKPLEQVDQQSNSGNGVTQSSASRSTKNVEQP
jgi:Mrp family chromosome partitioning ATPase